MAGWQVHLLIREWFNLKKGIFITQANKILTITYYGSFHINITMHNMNTSFHIEPFLYTDSFLLLVFLLEKGLGLRLWALGETEFAENQVKLLAIIEKLAVC